MKTMLVMSDTHGNKGAVARLKEIAGKTDYIVHLGDHSRDIEPIRAQYPERVFSVDGNCDLAFRTERTLEIEGVKVLLTHGHRFGVKSGLERLFYFCGERGIDLALYGHTHIAAVDESEGVKLINPGNLSRGSGEKSYAYLIFDKGRVMEKIVKVQEKLF